MLKNITILAAALSLFTPFAFAATNTKSKPTNKFSGQYYCPRPAELKTFPGECGAPTNSKSKYTIGSSTCSSSTAKKSCVYSCYSMAKKVWMDAGSLSCAQSK